jgi:hypothetical protein
MKIVQQSLLELLHENRKQADIGKLIGWLLLLRCKRTQTGKMHA